MKQDFPTGEAPKQAATFISRFMKVKGEFSQSNIECLGGCTHRQPLGGRKWSPSSLENWRDHSPVRAISSVRSVCYGIVPSLYNFFGILEKITLTLAHSLLQLGKWDSPCMRYLKSQGCLWEICHMRSIFLLLKNYTC